MLFKTAKSTDSLHALLNILSVLFQNTAVVYIFRKFKALKPLTRLLYIKNHRITMDIALVCDSTASLPQDSLHITPPFQRQFCITLSVAQWVILYRLVNPITSIYISSWSRVFIGAENEHIFIFLDECH